MSDTCTRCQKPVFAAEMPTRVPGGVYHAACFKCKACNTGLTLKSYTSKDGAIWCSSHVPGDSVSGVMDVTTQGQRDAPKQRLGGRTIAEKTGDLGSHYGAGAVAVETAKAAPQPTGIAGVNKMEVLNSGVTKLTSTSGTN